MKITDLEIGKSCYREDWKKSYLTIKRISMNSWGYFEHGEFSSMLKNNSTSFNHDDFKLVCKEQKMKIEDVKVIILETSKETNKASRQFESEDEALDYISDRLEESPRSRFIMFRPYQKVTPKRVDLKGLIESI